MNYRNRQKPSYSMMLALEPRMVFDGAVAVPDTAAIVADAAHVTGNVLSDGTPHDTGTGTLNVQGVASGSTTVPLNTGVNTTVNGLYGSLEIQANGSYDYSLNTSAANVMALGAGQPATDTFSYTMTDAAHNTSTTTLTIDITGVNHAPSAVADSTHITASAANVTGNLLTNDTDPDAGDTKTVSAIATANTAGNVGSALTGTYGSLTVNADGSYSYALDHNNAATLALPVGQTLTETFNYTTKDSGDRSASSTLTVTIDGTNSATDTQLMSTIPVDTTSPTTRLGIVNTIANATEIMFIDNTVADYQTLINDAKAGVEIILIDGNNDPWGQMTSYIAQNHDLTAVYIVSHGAEGEIILGNTIYTQASLQGLSNELATWQDAMAPGADILLYGCNIAAGSDGSQLIASLATLTGTNVAASTDTTGVGGNWVLEQQTGPIDATSAFTSQINQDYNYTLVAQSVTVTTGTNIDSTKATTGLIGAGKLITFSSVSLSKGTTNNMVITAYDVDYGMMNGTTPYAIGNAGSEWDGVYIKLTNAADSAANWQWVGFLNGFNNTWNTTTFSITNQLTAGTNYYDIRVVPDDNGTQTQANNAGR